MMNNIYLYESQILQQKLNYFILENKYNEIALNESIGDKLKSAKKFITDRIKDLIGLFVSLKDKIVKFFKEVVFKKIKEIKNKLLKNKSKNNNGVLETIDIKTIIRIIDDSDQEYLTIMNNAPSPLEYTSNKSLEELNETISKFQQYKFPSLDDIKKKLKVPEDINKTKKKITKKEIENIFKESEKRLVKNELDDIDNYISGLKEIYKEAEKTNESTYSDEEMTLFIKWHKVLISFETALITILNSVSSLHNQYVAKALSYFDKYLKEDKVNNDNLVTDDFKDSMTYAGKDLEKAIGNKNYQWLRGTIMNTMWNDPTFAHGETDKLINILKKLVPDLFEQEKKVPSEEHFDQSKWDKDYFIDLTYYFRENPSLSRIPYIKKVGKYVYRNK